MVNEETKEGYNEGIFLRMASLRVSSHLIA